MSHKLSDQMSHLAPSDVRILQNETQRRLEKWMVSQFESSGTPVSASDRNNQQMIFQQQLVNAASSLTIPDVPRRTSHRGESSKASSKRNVMKTVADRIYGVIRDRKTKFDKATHEGIMKDFLDYCVELKDTGYAREGFLKYRQLCQHIDPGSLETVIEYFLDSSLLKLAAACQRSDDVFKSNLDSRLDVRSGSSCNFSACLLSIGSAMDDRERVDQEICLVWLRFAWDGMRTCLDVLSKSQKMEMAYYKIVTRSLMLCEKTRKYSKSLEFKRLYEVLKDHLDSKVHYLTSSTTTNGTDWNEKLIDLCVRSRIEVIECCLSLGNYPLAIKAVASIHDVVVGLSGMARPSRECMKYCYSMLAKLMFDEDDLLSGYCLLKQIQYDDGDVNVLLANEIMLTASCLVDDDNDNDVELVPGLGCIMRKRCDVVDEIMLVASGYQQGTANKRDIMARLMFLSPVVSKDDLLAGISLRHLSSACSPEVAQLASLLTSSSSSSSSSSMSIEDWVRACKSSLLSLSEAGLLSIKFNDKMMQAMAHGVMKRLASTSSSLILVKQWMKEIGLSDLQVLNLFRLFHVKCDWLNGIIHFNAAKPVAQETKDASIDPMFSFDLSSTRVEYFSIMARRSALINNKIDVEEAAAAGGTIVGGTGMEGDKQSISQQILEIEQANLKGQQQAMSDRRAKLKVDERHALFAQKAVERLTGMGKEVDVSVLMAMTNEQITAYVGKARKALDGETLVNKKAAEERARLFYNHVKLCRVEEAPLVERKRKTEVERQLILFNDRKSDAVAKQQADLAKYEKLSRMVRFRPEFEDKALQGQRERFSHEVARAREESERMKRKQEEDDAKRATEEPSHNDYDDDDDVEVEEEPEVKFVKKKKTTTTTTTDDANAAYKPPITKIVTSKAPPNSSTAKWKQEKTG